MSANPIRPAWWQLFVVFLLGVVLLAIQRALAMSAEGHEFSQVLIVVVVFGLMFGWINKNAAVLVDTEPEPDEPAESHVWPQEASGQSSDERSYIVVDQEGSATNETLLARPEPRFPDVPAKAYPFRG